MRPVAGGAGPASSTWAIHLRDADGSNPRPLTRLTGARDTFNATWWPEGRSIAFEVGGPRPGRDGGERQSDLAIISADGSGERLLTSTRALETNPAFSPDGRLIAFTSDRHRRRGPRERGGRHFELYTMAVDGTRVTRLTRNRVPDLKPNWQPLPVR